MGNKNRKDYHFFLDSNNPLQRSAMEQIELCKELMGCTTKAAIVTLLCNKNIIIQDKDSVVTKMLEELNKNTTKPQSTSTVIPKNIEVKQPEPTVLESENKGTSPSLTVKEEPVKPQAEVKQPKESSSAEQRLQSLLKGSYDI